MGSTTAYMDALLQQLVAVLKPKVRLVGNEMHITFGALEQIARQHAALGEDSETVAKT